MGLQAIAALLVLVGILGFVVRNMGATSGALATEMLPRELQDRLLADALQRRMHVHTLGYKTTAVSQPTPPLLMRRIQSLLGRPVRRVGPMRLFRRVVSTPVPLRVDPPYRGCLYVAVVNYGLPEASPLAEPVRLETGGGQGEASGRVEITRGTIVVAPVHHPVRVTGKLFAVLFFGPAQGTDRA